MDEKERGENVTLRDIECKSIVGEGRGSRAVEGGEREEKEKGKGGNKVGQRRNELRCGSRGKETNFRERGDEQSMRN